jgi:microcystin-dependent protein
VVLANPVSPLGIATKQYVDAQIATQSSGGGGLPAGAIAHFAMNTPPTGWLKANGAIISRTTYAALFAAIGTTYGAGDGTTTFRLPDLRGEFLRGWDDGRGVDTARSLGSAQADALQSHDHRTLHMASFNKWGYGDGVDDIYINTTIVGGSQLQWSKTSPPYNASTGTETRPRNIALLVCIKT